MATSITERGVSTNGMQRFALLCSFSSSFHRAQGLAIRIAVQLEHSAVKQSRPAAASRMRALDAFAAVFVMKASDGETNEELNEKIQAIYAWMIYLPILKGCIYARFTGPLGRSASIATLGSSKSPPILGMDRVPLRDTARRRKR
jgi:hypothetical protein